MVKEREKNYGYLWWIYPKNQTMQIIRKEYNTGKYDSWCANGVGIAFQQFRQCAGRHDFDFYVFAARQCARGADTQAADEREDFVHTVGLFLVNTKVNIFFGVKSCDGINS